MYANFDQSLQLFQFLVIFMKYENKAFQANQFSSPFHQNGSIGVNSYYFGNWPNETLQFPKEPELYKLHKLATPSVLQCLLTETGVQAGFFYCGHFFIVLCIRILFSEFALESKYRFNAFKCRILYGYPLL